MRHILTDLVDFVSLASFSATTVSRSFHRRRAAPYRDVLLTVTVAVISPLPRSLPQRRLCLTACLPPPPPRRRHLLRLLPPSASPVVSTLTVVACFLPFIERQIDRSDCSVQAFWLFISSVSRIFWSLGTLNESTDYNSCL